MQIHELTLTAIMAALLCILSPLAIPLGAGVPISLATLAVMCAGALCGAKCGVLSVMTYILLGILGLPVFAGYSSGASIAFGMSGGYIFGYIPLALCTGLAGSKIRSSERDGKQYLILLTGMMAGTVILYFIGTVWFMKYTGTALSAALAACVLPFIPGDLIKMVLVCVLYTRLHPYLQKYRGK